MFSASTNMSKMWEDSIPYSNGRDITVTLIKSSIPLLFLCNSLPILFYITFPKGDDSCKTAKTVQKTNSHHTAPPRCLWPHPHHPTLGEKYKASLVWEHRDLSDTALYHGILPLSHNKPHIQPCGQRGSFSPLTFSEPLGPWCDAQTTHCTAQPLSPKVHVNTPDTTWQQNTAGRLTQHPLCRLCRHHQSLINIMTVV